MKSYAYVIIDKSFDENGNCRNKFYVGKSNNPDKRFKDHLRQSKAGVDTFFYRAIRSHGSENFFIHHIYECESELDALEKEKSLIVELKTYVGFEDCNGYNSTLGGDGVDSTSASLYTTKEWQENYESRCIVNKKRWDENPQDKDKLSKAIKAFCETEESKINKRNIMLERWKDEEYRLCMSEKKKEQWKNKDFRDKNIAAIKKSKSTEESKTKLAERNKKTWNLLTEDEKKVVLLRMKEARDKKSLQRKLEKKESKKQRKALGTRSKNCKESWLDPEKRLKRIEKIKEAWKDPEKRAERLRLARETRENKVNGSLVVKDDEFADGYLATKQEKESVDE